MSLVCGKNILLASYVQKGKIIVIIVLKYINVQRRFPMSCSRCLWSRSNFIFMAIAVCTALLVYWHIKRSSENQPLAATQSKIIFSFLGAPGAGKGTLAEQCVQKLGYKMLSTGNLCRENIANGTELGKKLQEYTSKGALVPDEIITGMVKVWLDANTRDEHPIILDGFPRTAAQAVQLLDLIKKYFPEYKLRVLALNISDDAVVERISGRLMCSNKQCQAIYNIKQFVGVDNPVCKRCGSPITKREDDKEEVVRERLKVYAATSKELIDAFKNAGLSIEEINVEGKESDTVFDIFKKLV